MHKYRTQKVDFQFSFNKIGKNRPFAYLSPFLNDCGIFHVCMFSELKNCLTNQNRMLLRLPLVDNHFKMFPWPRRRRRRPKYELIALELATNFPKRSNNKAFNFKISTTSFISYNINFFLRLAKRIF